MLTLEEIRKLTVAGQSVKGTMSNIEAAMKAAAISGESATTVSFTRSDMPSAEAWKTCRKILEDRGFVVVEDVTSGAAYSMAIAWSVKSASSPSVGKLHAVPESKPAIPEKSMETKTVKVALPKSDVVMVPASCVHVWRIRPKHIPRFDGLGNAYCNYHRVYHKITDFGVDKSKSGGINTTCIAGQREVIIKRNNTPMVPKIAENGYVYCTRCSRYHPPRDVSKNRGTLSGYADYCKKCMRDDRVFYLDQLAEKVATETPGKTAA